jgi:hypothetical protein
VFVSCIIIATTILRRAMRAVLLRDRAQACMNALRSGVGRVWSR